MLNMTDHLLALLELWMPKFPLVWIFDNWNFETLPNP